MQFTRPTRSLVFGILRDLSTASDHLEIKRRRIPSNSLLLVVCALAALSLSGCALLPPRSDPTRFYVLSVQSALPERTTADDYKRWKVGVRPVEVPSYLRTTSMVVRTGANEIHFAEFDRWGEPLDQGIGRVMKGILNSAPNVESVELDSHGDDLLDFEVRLQILACEGMRVGTGKSSLHFSVTWDVRAIQKNSIPAKRGVFTAEGVVWNGTDYGQLAERITEAVAGVSNAVAAAMPMEAKSSARASAEATKP